MGILGQGWAPARPDRGRLQATRLCCDLTLIEGAHKPILSYSQHSPWLAGAMWRIGPVRSHPASVGASRGAHRVRLCVPDQVWSESRRALRRGPGVSTPIRRPTKATTLLRADRQLACRGSMFREFLTKRLQARGVLPPEGLWLGPHPACHLNEDWKSLVWWTTMVLREPLGFTPHPSRRIQ